MTEDAATIRLKARKSLACAELKADLTEAVRLMREHASRVGPMHAWWDDISIFEDHLKECVELGVGGEAWLGEESPRKVFESMSRDELRMARHAYSADRAAAVRTMDFADRRLAIINGILAESTSESKSGSG